MPRLMASYVCKENNITCEWSFTDDDIGVVLVESIKHVEETHPEVFATTMAKQKITAVISTLLKIIHR